MFRYGLLTMAKRGQETTHERNNTTPAGVPPYSNNIINRLFSEASSPTIFILWLCLKTRHKHLFYCFGVDASANGLLSTAVGRRGKNL
jgi:hypothetical protein